MRRSCAPLLLAALAFALPLCARAESYDPTTLTASDIFAKAHAAYGTRIPGNYTEVETEHRGGVDWTVTTVWKGGDVKSTLTGAGFTSSSGIYQKQPWTQNENGIVTLRSNFRISEDPNLIALRNPDATNSNVKVLGVTQTMPKEYVVEVHPLSGTDEFRYYDAKTFLLAQIANYTSDRYRHVTEYSDYRKTFGMMLAYHVRSYDGRPQNDTAWTIDSYAPAAPGDDVSMPAGKTLFTYAGDTPLQIPARFTRDGILIRLTIDGRGMDFVLDSGASGLFMDPGAAVELGLKPVGRYTQTVGRDVDEGRVRVPHITLGALSIDDAVFHTIPFDHDMGGSRVVGLVGFDFLASGIFGIDLKKQTVTLYPRNRFDPQAMGLMGLGIQLDDGVPRTWLSVEGVHGHFLVDTGAFQMVAYKHFIDKLPSAVPETSQAKIIAVGGDVSSSVDDVTDIIFGGVKYNAGTIIVPNTSTFDFSGYDGLIGRDMLYNYRVYFDYGDGMLYVKETL